MKRKKQGYILVQVLVAIAALAGIMAIFAGDVHSNLAAVANRDRERRADAAADAAVARAEAVLEASDIYAVTTNDDWALQGAAGDNTFTFDGSDTTFRMQIVDCGSLLNLNTATEAQLDTLPLSSDQVDSLLDWLQTGETARTDGAKDSFYNQLTQPYNAQLGPMDTVNGLLLVDNWTAQNVYESASLLGTGGSATGSVAVTLPDDPAGNVLPLVSMLTVDSGAPTAPSSTATLLNLDQRGNQIGAASLVALGVPPPLAQQIVNGAPYTSYSQLFAVRGMTTQAEQGLLGSVSFGTATRATGKININTATLPVLETLPGVTSDIATAIVQQQSSGYTTLGQLATVNGITQTTLAAIADDFVVGGDTWLVRAYGEDNGVGVPIEAVVGVRNGEMEIINYEHLKTGVVPSWWGWNATPQQTTLGAGDSE